jgi:hypothetical protein
MPVPPDDKPPWVRNLVNEALRRGLRRDDAEGLREFMDHVARQIAAQASARGRSDPDSLELWQRDSVAKFWMAFISLLVTVLPEPPRSALLVRLFADEDEPVAIAVDEAVEVKVTAAGGLRRIVRPGEVVGASEWRHVEQVEPVGLHLGYVLWVGRWSGDFSVDWIVLAWDLRGPLMTASDVQIDMLLKGLRMVAVGEHQLSRGWHARNEREATLWHMDSAARREVTRQALEDELLGDTEHRRIPLRGFLRAGLPAQWDAGGTASPLGVLHRLSILLRAERPWRRKAEPLDDGKPAPPKLLTLIRDLREGLDGKEREATQHYLYCKLIYGGDFKAYCAQRGLPYEATSRAARRGLVRLREQHPEKK